MDTVMRIKGYMSREQPERGILAHHWAEKILQAVDKDGVFTDPVLEQEYQAWKKAREERH